MCAIYVNFTGTFLCHYISRNEVVLNDFYEPTEVEVFTCILSYGQYNNFSMHGCSF